MMWRIFKYVVLHVKRLLAGESAAIDRQAVIRDVIREVDISGGYFLVLNIANLIALIGLIMNSAPVIIGAMLISPLMGPILSTGFAFATGDKTIGIKAVRKIFLSLVVTIIIAALATYISPLKDASSEIIARTRPNLYDLFIAFFAGIVGAVAICKKKNIITIVPGVAIATAVIPPLSVTGFGIGVGSFLITAGGFLLFFTNFVAIIISTCMVFYAYGFRPVVESEADVSSMRKRVALLAALLFLISIPLIYTLHSSITQVRLRNNIQKSLKQEFDREGSSRLASFTYQERKDGKIEIDATVSTTSYLKESEIKKSESYLKDYLKSDVVLNFEQVKVQPGGLREEAAKPAIEPAKPATVPAILEPKVPADVLRAARNDAVATVRGLSGKIEGIIAPSSVEDFSVGFSRSSPTVSIVLVIRRDASLSAEQTGWLERIISGELGLPVNLQVKSTPFVPVLVFREGDASLTEEMKNSLLVLKELYRRDPFLTVAIEAYPESKDVRVNGVKLARERSAAVARLLVEICNLPADRIRTIMKKPERRGRPKVRLSVLVPEKR